MSKPFVIIRADWLTLQQGNENRKSDIIRNLQVMLDFFWEHNLLSSDFKTKIVDDNFEICSDDLNLMIRTY